MIRFPCTCGTQLELPHVLAGETGRCPRCRRSLAAPVPAGYVPWPDVRRGEEASDEVRIVQVARNPMATRTRALLAFPCASCGEPLRVKVAHAGKAGRCAACSATFTIPERPAPEGLGGSAPEPRRPRPTRKGPPRKATPTTRRPAPPQPAPRRRPPPARRAPPPLQGREAFRILTLACACGRRVKAPLARVRQGEARCPSCDAQLSE